MRQEGREKQKADEVVKMEHGFREMTKQLRALTALPQDLSSVLAPTSGSSKPPVLTALGI